jgi:hypothetical protein
MKEEVLFRWAQAGHRWPDLRSTLIIRPKNGCVVFRDRVLTFSFGGHEK